MCLDFNVLKIFYRRNVFYSIIVLTINFDLLSATIEITMEMVTESKG